MWALICQYEGTHKIAQRLALKIGYFYEGTHLDNEGTHVVQSNQDKTKTQLNGG